MFYEGNKGAHVKNGEEKGLLMGWSGSCLPWGGDIESEVKEKSESAPQKMGGWSARQGNSIFY